MNLEVNCPHCLKRLRLICTRSPIDKFLNEDATNIIILKVDNSENAKDGGK